MKIKKESLASYFSKLGMKLLKDTKNPNIYLVYPPGQPTDADPAKYLLIITKTQSPTLQQITGLAKLAQKLRKELLIPTSEKPPFNFLQIRKITSW